MKKQHYLSLLLALLILPQLATAQISFRLSDLFGQKKKERNNTLIQIGELQLYIQALRSGYRLVQDGLYTIRQIRQGEFDVHDLYYLSLKQVNPLVRQYPAAGKTLQQSLFVQRSLDQFLRQLRRDTLLSSHQKTFLRKTCAAVATDVSSLGSELQTLLIDGQLQLTDAERITRIEAMLERSHRQVAFTKSLCTSARQLVGQTLSAHIEAGTLERYYQTAKD